MTKIPRNCSRKQNNVWGSILQEESLTSDLNDIGVGRRSLRDIGSDRGAETYDYLLAQVTLLNRNIRSLCDHY